MPRQALDISLVTEGLSEEQAKEAIKQLEDETGLPTTDVWRFGAGKLLDAIMRNQVFTA